MAAYAALVSVMHIIDQLQLHPRPPISLHKNQVNLLTQKITFLQEFLEGYNPHLGYNTEVDPLESRIADAAYAAEDVIESHIVGQIRRDGDKMSSDALYEALEKVIEDITSIQKEAMEIKETVGVQHRLQTKSTPPDSLRFSSSITQKISMVGADELLLEMKDKLTADRLDLQIIPIVGMGGTGKTTLARNLYQDRLIQEHFDVCSWTTISQEYSLLEIFREVLGQLIDEVDQHWSEVVLGEMLHKHLYGSRYLIIMDDLWSVEAWDIVRRFFPDNKNGSRIVITTRLLNLASTLASDSNRLDEMKLLDVDQSWELLSKTVFGEEGCPLELQKIGKIIGISCRGLPLSIVVVGGFLAKSRSSEFWEHVEENLNSIVTLVDDKRCLRIIHMSYKQLPVHLKSCFLYMGVFPEDRAISVSHLIRLWISEGFLKPISGKSLEEMAKEYLKDIIDRNLIQVLELGTTGNIKYCKIHDLLREFCLIEAQKERFYSVLRPNTPRGIINTQRRIVISSCTSKQETVDALQSASLARSLIWDTEEELPFLNSSLLRIFHSGEARHSLEDMLDLVNSRYLAITTGFMSQYFSSAIYRFWNLQTLMVDTYYRFTWPHEIWYMTQIRHIKFRNISLPNPPSGQDGIVLANLQTLAKINNFNFSEEVVKRIPNLKKLKASYIVREGIDSLRNLACLHKLESLEFRMEAINPVKRDCLQSLSLPRSLKKLNISYCFFRSWQEFWETIGQLPFLEKLRVHVGRCGERVLQTVEGTFPRLKLLVMQYYVLLQTWTMESSHFPCLEHLVLTDAQELEDIPEEFAEIPTLRLIELKHCSKSVAISATRLVEMQEDFFGVAALRIRVVTMKRDVRDELENLACPNVQVIFRRS